MPQASRLLATSLAEEELADNLLTQIARELMSQTGDPADAHAEERVVQMQRPSPSERGNGKRTMKVGKAKSH